MANSAKKPAVMPQYAQLRLALLRQYLSGPFTAASACKDVAILSGDKSVAGRWIAVAIAQGEIVPARHQPDGSFHFVLTVVERFARSHQLGPVLVPELPPLPGLPKRFKAPDYVVPSFEGNRHIEALANDPLVRCFIGTIVVNFVGVEWFSLSQIMGKLHQQPQWNRIWFEKAELLLNELVNHKYLQFRMEKGVRQFRIAERLATEHFGWSHADWAEIRPSEALANGVVAMPPLPPPPEPVVIEEPIAASVVAPAPAPPPEPELEIIKPPPAEPPPAPKPEPAPPPPALVVAPPAPPPRDIRADYLAYLVSGGVKWVSVLVMTIWLEKRPEMAGCTFQKRGRFARELGEAGLIEHHGDGDKRVYRATRKGVDLLGWSAVEYEAQKVK